MSFSPGPSSCASPDPGCSAGSRRTLSSLWAEGAGQCPQGVHHRPKLLPPQFCCVSLVWGSTFSCWGSELVLSVLWGRVWDFLSPVSSDFWEEGRTFLFHRLLLNVPSCYFHVGFYQFLPSVWTPSTPEITTAWPQGFLMLRFCFTFFQGRSACTFSTRQWWWSRRNTGWFKIL